MRRSHYLPFFVALAFGCFGCGDDIPATQLVALITADDAVADETAQLVVAVEFFEGGASLGDGESIEAEIAGADELTDFDNPRTLGIASEGDSDSVVLIVRALDEDGDLIASRAISAEFMDRATVGVHVHLRACERSRRDACEDEEFCVGSECEGVIPVSPFVVNLDELRAPPVDSGTEPDVPPSEECEDFGDCPTVPNARSAECADGICLTICREGFADCDGEYLNGCEVDTDEDNANCGGCDVSCEGPNLVGECNGGECDSTCAGALLNCDDDGDNGCEVDPEADPENCGGCDVVCSAFGAVGTCTGGTCSFECEAGFADCDGNTDNGCETEIGSDLSNCGGCGDICNTPGGEPLCDDGVCRVGECAEGFANCDADPRNGCEADLSSPESCGDCGTTCDVDAGQRCDATGAMPMCGNGCPVGSTECEGSCVDTATSAANCGACGQRCELANSAPLCMGGSCVLACNVGFDDCDGDIDTGCEANLQTDVSTCGTCGTSCAFENGLSACASGSCELAGCEGSFGSCDGMDANGCELGTSEDVTNCGACGSECAAANATPLCEMGSCGIAACEDTFESCDADDANGCEVDTSSDVENCGGCDLFCALPNVANHGCSEGLCQADVCEVGFGDCNGDAEDGCEERLTSDDNCGACGMECPGGQTCAGGICSDVECDPGTADCDADGECETTLATDEENCGACGIQCALANAASECSAGVCVIAECQGSYEDCDRRPSTGCEVDTDESPTNCGGCRRICFASNSTSRCDDGACAIESCLGDFEDCDGDYRGGCEVNTMTSAEHCGGCDQSCALPNAVPSCDDGNCAIAGCEPGFEDCDGAVENGCEVDITTDSNCGACGVTCTGDLACNGSACALDCMGDLQDCNSDESDGCETDTSTSSSNCNDCGNVCSYANATGSCADSACSLGVCDTGFGDCDADPANGCETNTESSLSNCGACGTTCDLPNAGEACNGGQCMIDGCDSGWANCNGSDFDGCEASLNSPETCGACDTSCELPNVFEHGCAADARCTVVTCDPGFFNCDGDATNGCETQSDNDNCNGCNDACADGLTCQSQTCTQITCTAPFANCDSDPDDCETDTSDDLNHCGMCNNVCSTNNAEPECDAGVCSLICDDNYDDCDNNVADGCETAIFDDVANCGACGALCVGGGNTGNCDDDECICPDGWADCNNDLVLDGCEQNVLVPNDQACGASCMDCGTDFCGYNGAGALECQSGEACDRLDDNDNGEVDEGALVFQNVPTLNSPLDSANGLNLARVSQRRVGIVAWNDITERFFVLDVDTMTVVNTPVIYWLEDASVVTRVGTQFAVLSHGTSTGGPCSTARTRFIKLHLYSSNGSSNGSRVVAEFCRGGGFEHAAAGFKASTDERFVRVLWRTPEGVRYRDVSTDLSASLGPIESIPGDLEQDSLSWHSTGDRAFFSYVDEVGALRVCSHPNTGSSFCTVAKAAMPLGPSARTDIAANNGHVALTHDGQWGVADLTGGTPGLFAWNPVMSSSRMRIAMTIDQSVGIADESAVHRAPLSGAVPFEDVPRTPAGSAYDVTGLNGFPRRALVISHPGGNLRVQSLGCN